MLTLTRSLNQTVLIGDVKITILDIERGRVRFKIEAPKGVPIIRQDNLPNNKDFNR